MSTEVKKEEEQQLNPNTDETNQGAEPPKDEQQQDEKQGGGLNIMGMAGDSYAAAEEFMSKLFDWKLFWWEFAGTALFAHGIGASDGADWFITVSLFAGILLVAPFSGGHLNPAVSLGFYVKDGIVKDAEGNTCWRTRELLGRSCAQFLGACTGGFTAFTLLGMSAAPSIPYDDWTMLGGYFTGEAFGTFTFVLTILIMTDDRTKLVDEDSRDEQGNLVQKPKEYGYDKLATVATIALGLHFSRAFTYKTGGGLNPGIAVGLQIWLAIDEATWEPLIHSWLFIVGPCLGAALAALYYSTFHIAATNGTGCFDPKRDEKKEEEENQEEPQNKDEDDNKA